MEIDSQLLKKAINYLSYRSRSEKEIRDYLEKKSTSIEEIEAVISKLNQMGLIDDDDFIDQMISSYAKKHWGSKKIYFNLLNKGIDKSSAQDKLKQIPRELWQDYAIAFCQKKRSKWTTLEGYKKSQKLYQILYSRGYESNVIKPTIDAILHQE